MRTPDRRFRTSRYESRRRRRGRGRAPGQQAGEPGRHRDPGYGAERSSEDARAAKPITPSTASMDEAVDNNVRAVVRDTPGPCRPARLRARPARQRRLARRRRASRRPTPARRAARRYFDARPAPRDTTTTDSTLGGLMQLTRGSQTNGARPNDGDSHCGASSGRRRGLRATRRHWAECHRPRACARRRRQPRQRQQQRWLDGMPSRHNPMTMLAQLHRGRAGAPAEAGAPHVVLIA